MPAKAWCAAAYSVFYRLQAVMGLEVVGVAQTGAGNHCGSRVRADSPVAAVIRQGVVASSVACCCCRRRPPILSCGSGTERQRLVISVVRHGVLLVVEQHNHVAAELATLLVALLCMAQFKVRKVLV
jgi:hypothetical protein